VALARAAPGVYGARMTGGGFGGAIVLLAERGRAAEAAERTARAYHEKTGRAGRVLVPVRACPGSSRYNCSFRFRRAEIAHCGGRP